MVSIYYRNLEYKMGRKANKRLGFMFNMFWPHHHTKSDASNSQE